MTMRRRRAFEEFDRDDDRPKLRPVRAALDDDSLEDRPETAELSCLPVPEALVSLCSRFGLEPWASSRDEEGLWGFGSALAGWLQRSPAERPPGTEFQLETIHLLTNLLIILGAVIRLPAERPRAACAQALATVAAARRSIASRLGPVASFPGAARAMERLVRVRGWDRLTPSEQTLAEALLDLYLETLAATIKEPEPEIVLASSEAWLTVLHLKALPSGFDERLLRATSWYLESYASSRVEARV
jgi:hypothetical protein